MANKQGFSGYKHYNFLGISNLDCQTEYNQVRPLLLPITSQHISGNMNQELAHRWVQLQESSPLFNPTPTTPGTCILKAMYAIHGKTITCFAGRRADKLGGRYFCVRDIASIALTLKGQGMKPHPTCGRFVFLLINPKKYDLVGMRMRKSESAWPRRKHLINCFRPHEALS